MAELQAHQVARSCREMGEEAVRSTVAQGRGTPEWIGHAKEWLAGIDHELNASSQAENLATAKSAKDAAWEAANAARDAAREAKTANTIATLALAAAVIAMALSIIGLFLG